MSNANIFTPQLCGAIEKLDPLNCFQWPPSIISHFVSTEMDDIGCPPVGSGDGAGEISA